MEDLTIPKELLDEAEEMLAQKYNLKVPPAAEAKRKNGYTQWGELVQINSAHSEDVVSREGHEQTAFVLKVSILPTDGTANAGRNHTITNRVNYGVMKGSGGDPGQRSMSLGSGYRLKQIAVAAGIDLEATSGNLTGDILSTLFPVQGTAGDMDGEAFLIGKRFMISIRDNSGKKYPPGPEGENQQDVVAFAPGGEDA